MTAQGPRVIEFNARFGDPETQVVLALLETPLAALLCATATATLGEQPPLRWHSGAAVTVVLAAAGYPDRPQVGDLISGSERDGVVHAATRRRDDGAIVSSGGRIVSATAVGATVAQARQRAYDLVDQVEFDGRQYRRDIAAAVSG